MLNNRLHRCTASPSSRGGFTLVELLVVIGIIAILAGVALGPITRGIKQAKQSGGLQTSRTIALSEFAFSNDNSGNYPDKSYVNGGGNGDASDVAKCLIGGNYISDASIFWISGSKYAKYAGTTPATSITKATISWDFAGATGGTGVNSNTPDQMPIVWSSLGADPGLATGGAEIDTPTLTTTMPFGQDGIAMCFKSNSAVFQTVKNDGNHKAKMVDATYPGWASYNYLGGGG